MTNRRRTSTSWPEAVGFYRALVEENASQFQPMLSLVEFLASSRYAASLFPCASHEALLIGRVANFAAGDNELQIQFDGKLQRFKFTYVRSPDDLNPGSRECEAAEWRPVLERLFHKRLQWFHEG